MNIILGGEGSQDVSSHSNPYARENESTILRSVVLAPMEKQPLHGGLTYVALKVE